LREYFFLRGNSVGVLTSNSYSLLSDLRRWAGRGLAALLLALFLTSSLPAQTSKPSSANFATLSAQAERASQENRLDEAVALYGKALALRPSWPEGWWALGTLHYDRNAYQEAATAFQRAVALQPKAGSPRVMLGLCEFELGQDDAALKNIYEGRRLGLNPDPQFQKVMLYHQGTLLLRKGRFESAGEVFSELAEQGVNGEEADLGLGMSVLRILPRDLPGTDTPGRQVVLRAGKAESLAAQKKFEDAGLAYSALLAEFPDFPNLHYALGRFLLETHEVDAAVAAFQEEIAKSPQSVPARLQIAAARYRTDSAAGLAYAREAVKLQPQLPFGHYLLGLLLLDTGDFRGAIPELEAARKGLSGEAGIYFALGNAYARAGRKAEAAEARETFKRLDKGGHAGNSSEGINVSPSGDAKQDNLRGASDAKPPA
jgi:tetratricopeptide (TPR) repeat protein